MMLLACAVVWLGAHRLGPIYPSKPICFYAPYPPGGTTGITARLEQASVSLD